jgi:acetyltransferase-like isoleucine patch superfamily enzyme
MIKQMIIRFLYYSGNHTNLYKKIAHPNAKEWASYLKYHSLLESIGEGCEINRDAVITDPYLVRIGNNVTLSSCHLISHDGSIAQVFRATGKKVDAVGKIDIRDNCFIGYNAIVLRNVIIGANSIVAAGCVVTKNIPEGVVVAGVPAKIICSISDFGHKLENETKNMPWAELIYKREGVKDSHTEPTLQSMRKDYFWK